MEIHKILATLWTFKVMFSFTTVQSEVWVLASTTY